MRGEDLRNETVIAADGKKDKEHGPVTGNGLPLKELQADHVFGNMIFLCDAKQFFYNSPVLRHAFPVNDFVFILRLSSSRSRL